MVGYLKFTRDLGITFKPGFAESDEAVRMQLIVRGSKSYSGICFALGEDNGKFMSTSRKQSTVTMFSCESELGGAVEATKSIIWLRNVGVLQSAAA